MSGLHKIFSARENCITEDQLLSYVQHKLSPFEQHQVEKHLLDCELCSDALEGLRMASGEKLSETFAQINQQIDERVKQGEKNIIPLYPWLRIAAVVVLLAVSAGTFLYLQKQQKKEEKIVAEKQISIPPASQNNFELKSAEPVKRKVPVESLTQNAPTTPALIQKNNIEPYKETKFQDAATSATMDVAKDLKSEPLAVAEQQKILEAIDEKETKSLNDITFSEPQPATNENVTTTVSGSVREETKYLKKAKSDIVALPSNSVQLLANAKLQLENNNYDSANHLLDQVIINNDTKYVEEAMWNKSIALKNLNRNDDAKIILKKIVIMNGKYKKHATKKLKEW